MVAISFKKTQGVQHAEKGRRARTKDMAKSRCAGAW